MWIAISHTKYEGASAFITKSDDVAQNALTPRCWFVLATTVVGKVILLCSFKLDTVFGLL